MICETISRDMIPKTQLRKSHICPICNCIVDPSSDAFEYVQKRIAGYPIKHMFYHVDCIPTMRHER